MLFFRCPFSVIRNSFLSHSYIKTSVLLSVHCPQVWAAPHLISFFQDPVIFNFSQIQYHVCIVVLLLKLYVKSHSLMGTMNPSKVGYFFYECLSCDSLLPMITGSQSVFVSCLSACFVPAPCGSTASDLSMGVPFAGDSLLAMTRPPQIKGDGSEPALIQPPLCPRKVTSQNRRIHEWTHFKFACFRVWEEWYIFLSVNSQWS